MIELPISNNLEILKKLYRRYDYLQDLPCEIKANWIDEARHLGNLETDDFLGFVLGYPVEKDFAGSDRFAMLSTAENQAIAHYRLLKPVLPWPQPIIGVQMGPLGGVTTGTHSVPVILKDCGNAQLWWGGEVAVLWEAFLEGDILERIDYEALINQLWGNCEDFLQSQGIQRIYTYDRDHLYPLDWYQAFLQRRGYRAVAGRKATVVKELGK